jgi:archaellum component FlaC
MEDYKEIILGFIAGTIPSLIPLLKRSKKDQDAAMLKLIEVLQAEIERVRKQVEATENQLVEVKENYAKLQNEYDILLKKYNQLKNEFNTYKKTRDDISNN